MMLTKRKKTWLLILPPLVFLIKDVFATVIVLATEPGITAKTISYYRIALLPGTLLVRTGMAFFVNIVFAAFLSLILYVSIIRPKARW